MSVRLARVGGVVLAAGVAAVGLGLGGTASAAPATTAPPVPSASCKVPSLTITPTAGKAGTVVKVSGQNFSGCKLKSGSVVPTSVLRVKVGVVNTATKKSTVLATVSTTSAGTFSTSVTIPTETGSAKIGVVAATQDPATKLDYFAVRPFLYRPAATSSPSPSASVTTTPAPPSPSTSMQPSGTSVPTAVPAGLGSSAATTSAATRSVQLAVGAGGLLLAAVAMMMMRRRRSGEHR